MKEPRPPLWASVSPLNGRAARTARPIKARKPVSVHLGRAKMLYHNSLASLTDTICRSAIPPRLPSLAPCTKPSILRLSAASRMEAAVVYRWPPR
jgi:hypothetical protein